MASIQPIKILGNMKFLSFSLKMPTEWKQPSGDPDAEHYGDSIPPEEKIAIPSLIPPWYMPENMHKHHQQACDDKGKWVKELQEACIDAVVFSHDMWRLQAKFKDLIVMAVCAIGTPGCLDGPELEGNIKNAPSVAKYKGTDNGEKWVAAVAKGISSCYKEWQDKVMVPGLPWYPAFAAFPGPQMAPTPNVPMPLITCPSPMMTKITLFSELRDAMVKELDQGIKDNERDYEEIMDAIATPLSLAFLMWLPMQMIIGVIGKGPGPAFAPPYVPVSPCVGGDNIAAPGHFAA